MAENEQQPTTNQAAGNGEGATANSPSAAGPTDQQPAGAAVPAAPAEQTAISPGEATTPATPPAPAGDGSSTPKGLLPDIFDAGVEIDGVRYDLSKIDPNAPAENEDEEEGISLLSPKMIQLAAHSEFVADDIRAQLPPDLRANFERMLEMEKEFAGRRGAGQGTDTTEPSQASSTELDIQSIEADGAVGSEGKPSAATVPPPEAGTNAETTTPPELPRSMLASEQKSFARWIIDQVRRAFSPETMKPESQAEVNTQPEPVSMQAEVNTQPEPVSMQAEHDDATDMERVPIEELPFEPKPLHPSGKPSQLPADKWLEARIRMTRQAIGVGHQAQARELIRDTRKQLMDAGVLLEDLAPIDELEHQLNNGDGEATDGEA